MRNILVLGGTRFFGFHLVNQLVANGDKVTVASRTFSRLMPSEVQTLKIDRDDRRSLQLCKAYGPFDIIYDQICFTSNAALDVVDVFEGCVGKIIHTSTQSVYLSNGLQKESDLNAFTYPVVFGGRDKFDYGEGKRQAEAVYFQKTKIPVAAVRIPYVMGVNDYTGRLNFHVEKVQSGTSWIAPNPSAQFSAIHEEEAADFLFWIAQQDFRGPINACSDGKLNLQILLSEIESCTGKRALVKQEGDFERSPYSQEVSRFLDASLAQEMGFRFRQINNWLPHLVKELAKD